ncbi:MAG: amidohydrolase family protein [bacterium]|nr:amidohydrolase family protein [bacterium]
MIYESVKKGAVSESTRREFRDKALEIAKAGAVGFGEMTALHFSLHSEHPFYEAPPDHPFFLLLSDLSAETGLPIDLHMEAVTTDALPFPYDRRTRASKHNPKTLKENIKPLERLLSHNRKAKVVWVHIGWDNIGHMTVGLLSRLLKEHPNLYMSFKGYSHILSANRPLDKNNKLRPEWKNLIARFPDRFVFGCDGFYGLPGKTKTFSDSTTASRLILNQLPPNIARKVAYENANHIYAGKRVKPLRKKD